MSPTRKKDIALVALAAVLMLLLTACGQKPWIAEQQAAALRANPGAYFDPTTGQLVDAQGNPISGTGSGPTTAGGGEGTEGSEGTEGTEGTEGKTIAGDDDPGAKNPPTGKGGTPGATSIGVTATVIKIGFHAPLTGAAPVPSDSVSKGKDLYFRYHGKVVAGRTVEVVLRNDTYNPSTAVAVCKEMVQSDKVFLLSGAAGTDQIAACARYAESVNVPYLSAGVTEAGLTGLRTYFATSMTYPDQGPMLARYMASTLGAKGEKNGMLWFNTASFQDAHSAFLSGMKSVGASVDYDGPYSKGSGDQQASQAVTAMKTAQIENVYVLTSPAWFLRVLVAAKAQQFEPQWVGVGITMTFDTVASAGCRTGTINGAKFFSPFPAWIDSKKYDPNFDKAVRQFHAEENGGDDFMWLSWAFSVVGSKLMSLPGRNLTRERFIYFAERARVNPGMFPALSFSPSDRYGASTAVVNEAQCSGYKAGDARWHTIADYRSY
jgi:branched-chain amino acid transport system substrate-binding protein